MLRSGDGGVTGAPAPLYQKIGESASDMFEYVPFWPGKRFRISISR
jgi:hypothetical protein